jgi:CRP-like cAMP-binding protein
MGHAITAGDVRAFRCFCDFSDAEAGAVARLLEPLRLARGEALFHQGDTGDAIYLLVAGLLEIRVRLPGQDEHLCATLEAGALFGEISPLLGEPRKASAVAATDCVLWQLPSAALRTALDRGETWAGKFLLAAIRVLARRLVALNGEVMALLGGLRRSDGTSGLPDEAELDQVSNRMFDAEVLGLLSHSMV